MVARSRDYTVIMHFSDSLKERIEKENINELMIEEEYTEYL